MALRPRWAVAAAWIRGGPVASVLELTTSARRSPVPRRRVCMRQIGEVLRLAAQHLSYDQIAQSVGISRTNVHNYLKRAQQAGLSWPLPEHLDDAAAEARLFQRSEETNRPGRPEPNWLEVHREHKRGKHVTLQLLHLEYKAAHPDGWGYTQFCTHYRRWLGRQDVVMRLEYAAGERMFVDSLVTQSPSLIPKRARSGKLRCSSRCWAPAATCTSRRPGVRTWHRGWVPMCERWSSTGAQSAWWSPTT